MPQRIAFLDRDGTLIHEPPLTKFVAKPDDVHILPGVIDGLKALQQQGYLLFIVSNQGSGPTRAEREAAFVATQTTLIELLAKEGIHIAATFMCPHTAEDDCRCRKPKTGMVEAFLREQPVDYEHSLMIGDRETDREFAEKIGVRFVGMENDGTFPVQQL